MYRERKRSLVDEKQTLFARNSRKSYGEVWSFYTQLNEQNFFSRTKQLFQQSKHFARLLNGFEKGWVGHLCSTVRALSIIALHFRDCWSLSSTRGASWGAFINCIDHFFCFGLPFPLAQPLSPPSQPLSPPPLPFPPLPSPLHRIAIGSPPRLINTLPY